MCLGVVVGAHGVRGQVRIKSFTADPADVGAYGPVEDDAATNRFRLKVASVVGKGVVVATLPGVADRNAAEALKGMRLWVARAALPAPEDEDEYYWSDLIGLAVETDDGGMAGSVEAVHDFGAGAMLEVKRPDGPSVMVPFTRAVVPVVDVKGGRVVVATASGVFAPPDASEADEGDEGASEAK